MEVEQKCSNETGLDLTLVGFEWIEGTHVDEMHIGTWKRMGTLT
jgi:hypothetical protein